VELFYFDYVSKKALLVIFFDKSLRNGISKTFVNNKKQKR